MELVFRVLVFSLVFEPLPAELAGREFFFVFVFFLVSAAGLSLLAGAG
jgi:hypothetical protein